MLASSGSSFGLDILAIGGGSPALPFELVRFVPSVFIAVLRFAEPVIGAIALSAAVSRPGGLLKLSPVAAGCRGSS
jgi:hypothetical protein